MTELQQFKEMFQWCPLSGTGLLCNPSPGWGQPNHECVGITQLAWIAQNFNWQVVLPWSYGSHELATGLSEMLPLRALQRVTLALMARNFHKLWQRRGLGGDAQDPMSPLSGECATSGRSKPISV